MVVTGEVAGVHDDLADDVVVAQATAASVSAVWRAGSVAGRQVLKGSAQALVDRAWRTLETPADRAALRRSLGREPDDRMTRPAHRIVGPVLPKEVREAADVGVPRGGEAEIASVERAFYTVAALIASQPRSAREASSAGSTESTEPAGTQVIDSPGTLTSGSEQGPASEAPSKAAEFADSGVETAPGASDDGARQRRAAGRGLGRCLADAVNEARGQEQNDLYGRLEARLRLLCRQDVDGLHRHLPRLVRHLRSEEIAVDWVRLLLDLAYWGVDADLVAKTWLQQFYGYARPASPGQAEAAVSGSDQSGASAAQGGAVNNGENTRP